MDQSTDTKCLPPPSEEIADDSWPLTRRLPAVLAAFMCAIVLWRGIQTTWDINLWPYDWDLFRDLGQAQTARDGHPLADPAYRGETLWYNPLVPWTVAVLSRALGVTVQRVQACAGPILNLLAPVAFWFMVRRLFNPWTATASLAGFLFVSCRQYPSWAAATYSPWLFSINLAQSFFYIALLLYHRALKLGTLASLAWVGAVAGVAFLSHAAPALLLAAVVGSDWSVRAWRRGAAWRQIVQEALAMAAPALLVSLPFLISIVGNYRMRTLNDVPGGWVWGLLDRDHFRMLFGQYLNLPFLWPLCGLAALVLRRAGAAMGARRLVLLWCCWSAAGVLVYGPLRTLASGYGCRLPSLVPPSHFFFFLNAAQSLLLGVGIVFAARGVAVTMRKALPRTSQTRSTTYDGAGFLMAWAVLLVVLLAWATPRYVQRADFGTFRVEALGFPAYRRTAFDWIRRCTVPESVFLTDAGDADVCVVSSAGRKLVAIAPIFSNPYVDWTSRDADRKRMVMALRKGKPEEFFRLAASYDVSFILLEESGKDALSVAPFEGRIQSVFKDGPLTVYRLVSRFPPRT